MYFVARKYTNSGLSVLPVKSDKSPATAAWKGIEVPGREFRDKNGIGVKCGKESGNLECLDFDNHFGDAKRTLTQFVKEIEGIYEKYEFVIELTQNDGYHFLYRCSEVSGNMKLAQRAKLQNGKERPDTIIETRGEGGYFVAAPTEGYKVIRGSILLIPEITPRERDIIFEVARSFNQWIDADKREHSEDEVKDRPGDLFNSDISSPDKTIAVLKKHGWTEPKTGMWRRPGKDEGISATFGKAGENIFYNFSSNSDPFQPNHGYSMFSVVAHLDYNGDFKKFSKELAEQYKDNLPEKRKYPEAPKSFDGNELDEILSKCMVDTNIQITRPPNAMTVIDKTPNRFRENRLFTLGNFSAVIGKSKSKKTFFCRLLMVAAATGRMIHSKLKGTLPPNKDFVVFFDTEQSVYDCHSVAKSIQAMAGSEIPNFAAFSLREYSPRQRVEIIEYAMEKMKDHIGFVVIDGIADLANAINDEEEATKIITLLMKWTSLYNCHVVTVIHQNKGDNYATGHLGSYIMKKAECVISVTRYDEDKDRSRIANDYMRGTVDFDDFDLLVNEYGLPELDNALEQESKKRRI